MALFMDFVNPRRMPFYGDLLRWHPFSTSAYNEFDPWMVSCCELVDPLSDMLTDELRRSWRGRNWRDRRLRHPGGISPKWVTHVDVSGFRPDDIHVQEADGVVKIHAIRQEGDEDQGLSHREFKKNVKLPPDVDPKTVRSMITDNGELTLVARRRLHSVKITGPDGKVVESEEPKAVKGESEMETDEDPEQREKNLKEVAKKKSQEIAASAPPGTIAQFNLKGFEPKEVSVGVVGDNIFVHAEQEKEDNGVQVKRRFFRSFTVPEKVNVGAITSSFTDDGKLILKEQENKTDDGTEGDAKPMEGADKTEAGQS